MKVTVVTTVLNQAADLDVTIRSVLALERPDLEYIVIDGGSTDGSVDIIKSYAGQLKHWQSKSDSGVYDAMNRGWELANPESRILYLGAGDQLLALPRLAELEADPQAVIYGKVEFDGGAVFHPRVGCWLRLYNSLHHQALLIPRNLHPRPPFDLRFPLYADFDFNQRLLRQGARFQYSADLCSYASPGGLTQELAIEELADVTRKNFGPFWSGLAKGGYSLSRRFSLLHNLRPIH